MKIDSKQLFGYAIVIILTITATLAAMTLMQRTRPAPIKILPPEPTATPEPTSTPGPIKVFVNGAVIVENTYTLPPDSRVEAAIEAAGGFAPDANRSVINLAQSLDDGMQVYVPTLTEDPGEPPIVVMPRSGGSDTILDTAVTNGIININTADANALESLPGVGPSTAEKILEYREANGPFTTIEDIMQVPGIGEGKFAEMQNFITVDN
ncbi:MAG: helix-hairpin-helix domain-containing protein [Anaerolineales bacterium]|nr:helix-hairpin-helix domain-containing protein [Anaerolineales bacterium]